MCLVVATVPIAACGGSGANAHTAPTPTADLPSIAAGTLLTVKSGESDTPVAGATLTLQGQSPAGPFSQTYVADSAGTITLDRAVLITPRALVDVSASGFLHRATTLRVNQLSFSLWPAASPTGLDEDFSSTLVYSASSCPARNTGAAVLRRLGPSVSQVQVTFAVTPPDARARAAHEQAIARLNAALGGSLQYVLAEAASGDNVFTVHIDPNHSACTAGPEPLRASANVDFRDGNIVSGRITFCTVEAARSLRLVLHELGHTVGLYHSSSQADVMYCSSGRPASFSPRETLAMTLMRQRLSGNRWPDTDRGVFASAAPSSDTMTVCEERPSRR